MGSMLPYIAAPWIRHGLYMGDFPLQSLIAKGSKGSGLNMFEAHSPTNRHTVGCASLLFFQKTWLFSTPYHATVTWRFLLLIQGFLYGTTTLENDQNLSTTQLISKIRDVMGKSWKIHEHPLEMGDVPLPKPLDYRWHTSLWPWLLDRNRSHSSTANRASQTPRRGVIPTRNWDALKRTAFVTDSMWGMG